MRIWTLHPSYLDAKGIVALWREGLLAKAVLEEKTRGYRNHPQLIRFREHKYPLPSINEYLRYVLLESQNRDYHFDRTKLSSEIVPIEPIEETTGQLNYEWKHLLNKLKIRDHKRFEKLSDIKNPASHPIFKIVSGDIRYWEKTG